MKRFAISVVVALAIIAPAAQAKPQRVLPPGNSGASEYVESIPTVAGNRPTSSVHPVVGSVGGGGGGGGGGSGATAGTSTAGTSSAGTIGTGTIGVVTARVMSAEGTAGRSAAALAQATAPSVAASVVDRRHGSGAKSQPTTAEPPAAAPELSRVQSSSPVGALADALTGSAASGGLGPFVPVLLALGLVGSLAVALTRRRS
ncbi:MAG: hypothetical protein ACLP50_17905 [Solirubrobacteraceae bacterium]